METARVVRKAIERISNGLLTVVSLAAVASMLVSIYVSVRLAVNPSLARPAIEYSQEMYYPAQVEYCPGERLRVDYTARINRTGVNVVIETIWSAAEKRTVVVEREPHYTINPARREISTFTEIEVPELATGLYELRHASYQESSRPAIWTAPFVVPERCFNN